MPSWVHYSATEVVIVRINVQGWVVIRFWVGKDAGKGKRYYSYSRVSVVIFESNARVSMLPVCPFLLLFALRCLPSYCVWRSPIRFAAKSPTLA